jgi:hypothetical protein
VRLVAVQSFQLYYAERKRLVKGAARNFQMHERVNLELSVSKRIKLEPRGRPRSYIDNIKFNIYKQLMSNNFMG